MRRLRVTQVQLLAIVGLGLALAMRLWALGFGTHVPLARPDEELFLMSGYSYYGTPSAADTLGVTGWPMGFVRLVHLVEILERFVLRAPSGQPANLGCLYMLQPTAVLVGIRAVSVLCDVLTCLVVGLTARRLAKREHSDLAFAFGILAYAVNYLAAREAHNGMMNSALGLGIALTTLACVRAIQGSTWWLVAAGALAGASFGIKYSASPLLLACLAAGIGCLWRKASRTRTLEVGAITLVAAIAGLWACSPEIFSYPEPFWRGLMSAVGRYQPSFNGMLDLSWHPIPGWRFHLFTNLPTAFGWVGYLLAIAGLGIASRDRGWEAAPVVATAVGAALMLAPVTQLFVRYGVPILPALAVGLGLALTRLSAFAATQLAGLRASLLVGTLAVLALGPPLVRLCQYDYLLSKPDTRELAQRWLLSHGGTGASLGYYQRIHFVEPSWVEACRGKVPTWAEGPVAETPNHGAPFWADLVPKDPESLTQETLDAAFKGNDLSTADYVFWPAPVVMCGKQGRTEASEPSGQCYELADTLSPGTPACGDLFDMFDSFFVPYTAFDGVVRPGPAIKIYKNLCKH